MLLGSSLCLAGGFDRSSHPYDGIFSPGTSLSFSFLGVKPGDRTISTQDRFADGAVTASSPLQPYQTFDLSIKTDVSSRLACMLQYDPSAYGVESDYQDQIPLGPELTDISGEEYSAICSVGLNVNPDSRFKVLLGTSRRKFSLYASQNTDDGLVPIGGLLGIAGFSETPIDTLTLPFELPADLVIDLKGSEEMAARFGLAYENPSLNIRFSFMYTGATNHDMSGRFTDPVFEEVGKATSSIRLPESYDISLQTGLSQKWRMGASIGFNRTRWDKLPGLLVEHDTLLPDIGFSLFDKKVDVKYVSVGKEFSDRISAGARYIVEGDRGGSGGGLRGASDGRETIAAGLLYKVSDQLSLSPRVAFTRIFPSNHRDLFVDARARKSYSRAYGVEIKYRFD